jgi:hypothetical protein
MQTYRAVIPDANIRIFLLTPTTFLPTLPTVTSFSLIALINLPYGEFNIVRKIKKLMSPINKVTTAINTVLSPG